MLRENARVGQAVVFGRRNGEQTKGVIETLNRVKAKVRSSEDRGSRGLSGEVWGVPYSMMTAMTSGYNPATMAGGPVRKNPADADFLAQTFESPIISKAMGIASQIYCNLSPENLHCDGEISRSQARAKAVVLNRQLKGVFQILGREVSESVVYKYMEQSKELQASFGK